MIGYARAADVVWIHPGENVGLGKDYTLFARIDGIVKYEKKGKDKKQVSVYTQTL